MRLNEDTIRRPLLTKDITSLYEWVLVFFLGGGVGSGEGEAFAGRLLDKGRLLEGNFEYKFYSWEKGAFISYETFIWEWKLIRLFTVG